MSLRYLTLRMLSSSHPSPSCSPRLGISLYPKEAQRDSHTHSLSQPSPPGSPTSSCIRSPLPPSHRPWSLPPHVRLVTEPPAGLHFHHCPQGSLEKLRSTTPLFCTESPPSEASVPAFHDSWQNPAENMPFLQPIPLDSVRQTYSPSELTCSK